MKKEIIINTENYSDSVLRGAFHRWLNSPTACYVVLGYIDPNWVDMKRVVGTCEDIRMYDGDTWIAVVNILRDIEKIPYELKLSGTLTDTGYSLSYLYI